MHNVDLVLDLEEQKQLKVSIFHERGVMFWLYGSLEWLVIHSGAFKFLLWGCFVAFDAFKEHVEAIQGVFKLKSAYFLI